MMRPFIHLCCAFLGAAALGGTPGPGGPGPQAPEVRSEQAQEIGEFEIKAAFLYNFVRLSTWPEKAFGDGKQAFVVAVLGKDPFGPLLEVVFKGKSYGERPVVVWRIKGLEEAAGAHLLVVGMLEGSGREQVIAFCRSRPVLLVTDSPGSAAKGAVINFYLEGRKVRFEVNQAAMKRTGVQISSQVLKLARQVEDES